MFKEERQQKIVEILAEKTYISVNKLSRLLYVSLPTVRRDLSELEKKGMIVDTYFSETMLKKEIFKNCKNKVFLYDKTKKDLDAPYNVIPIDEAEILITP